MARIAGRSGGRGQGMSKAVLISIRPKWCEKIISGEKTIEVRKTRPKMKTPFKGYIYCTRNGQDYDRLWVLNDQARKEYDGLVAVCANLRGWQERHFLGNGKVIGEFICDRVYELAPLNHAPDDAEQQTCLTQEEIARYLKGIGYGWHISGLKIYDTPRELREFTGLRQTKFGAEPVPITRPPQSWCYVEDQTWKD